MKTVIIVIIVIAAILLFGGYYLSMQGQKQGQNQLDLSTENEVKTDGYKNLSPSELDVMLENKDFKLVDVHIPEQPHIPGTDMFIPFNETERIVEALSDKKEKIVLYCRSGSMSRQVSEELVSRGYTDVSHLERGVNGGRAEGRETLPIGSVQ